MFLPAVISIVIEGARLDLMIAVYISVFPLMGLVVKRAAVGPAVTVLLTSACLPSLPVQVAVQKMFIDQLCTL